MYGEDLELGLRAGVAGVATWFWPRARVVHTGAHATAGAFGGEDFARLARTRHAAIAIARGERAAGRDDVAQALTFASRAAVKRLLGRGGERELRQLAAVRALRRG
jgi:GT2 family glycosyltransferase